MHNRIRMHKLRLPLYQLFIQIILLRLLQRRAKNGMGHAPHQGAIALCACVEGSGPVDGVLGRLVFVHEGFYGGLGGLADVEGVGGVPGTVLVCDLFEVKSFVFPLRDAFIRLDIADHQTHEHLAVVGDLARRHLVVPTTWHLHAIVQLLAAGGALVELAVGTARVADEGAHDAAVGFLPKRIRYRLVYMFQSLGALHLLGRNKLRLGVDVLRRLDYLDTHGLVAHAEAITAHWATHAHHHLRLLAHLAEVYHDRFFFVLL